MEIISAYVIKQFQDIIADFIGKYMLYNVKTDIDGVIMKNALVAVIFIQIILKRLSEKEITMVN